MKAEAEGDLSTPPFVVFVAGGPGCGKGTQCAKLREDSASLASVTRGGLSSESYVPHFLDCAKDFWTWAFNIRHRPDPKASYSTCFGSKTRPEDFNLIHLSTGDLMRAEALGM